jgi:lipooligosaccharide transport system permease protein
METLKTIKPVPPLWRRLAAICYRHSVVYNRNFFTNSFGVILEPLMFFAAMGLGLAAAVGTVNGVDYLSFLAPGQVMIGVFFSAAFETSYGTYFRLEMDHNYDSMVVTPISADEVFWGELIYVGIRSAFFGGIILTVFTLLGLVHSPWALLVPLVAFFSAITLGSLGFFANRLVKSINQFNYFITGVVSPLMLFSGTLFPISSLPKAIGLVVEWLPFYPSVHLARMLTTGHFEANLWIVVSYVVLAPWPLGYFAVRCMRPKLIK